MGKLNGVQTVKTATNQNGDTLMPKRRQIALTKTATSQNGDGNCSTTTVTIR